MGRPDQSPSPRMNNNYNPMFHAQHAPEAPEPPVYEKKMVETERKYAKNDGMVNQSSGVPHMGRPAQPTYINPGGIGNQTYAAQMARPVISNQQGEIPNMGPAQPKPTYINPGGMGNQPYVQQMVRPIFNQQRSNWTSGLCDCMNDCENTIITFCFPCITFGQIAEVTDEGATSCGMGAFLYVLIYCLFWAPCVYSCTYRTKIRSKFGLPDAPAPDWITHCFCEYCALCQEYRELKNRGLDPSIGWIGNVRRQQMVQQQEMMAPPTGQRMMG